MAFSTVQIYHDILSAKVPSNSMWLNKTNRDNLEKSIDSLIQTSAAAGHWHTCCYHYKNWKEFESIGFTVVYYVDSASGIREQLSCANHYERIDWRCQIQRYKMVYEGTEPGLYIYITANCGSTDGKLIKLNSLNEFADIMLNEEVELLKYLADNYKVKYNRASECAIEYMDLADDIKTIITDAGFGVGHEDVDIATALLKDDVELEFELLPNGFIWENSEIFSVEIFRELRQDGTILRFIGGYDSISRTMARIMTARTKVPGDCGYSSARNENIVSDVGVNVKTVDELMKIIKAYVNTVATVVRSSMELKYPLNIPNEDDD